jgi:hypothetical protein
MTFVCQLAAVRDWEHRWTLNQLSLKSIEGGFTGRRFSLTTRDPSDIVGVVAWLKFAEFQERDDQFFWIKDKSLIAALDAKEQEEAEAGVVRSPA